MRLLISSIILLASLLFGIPVGSAQRPATVTISCTPAQTLMLGVGADGKLIRIENWDALCVVTSGDQILGRYAFQPVSQVPETKQQAEIVCQDMVTDIQKYLHERREDNSNL